MATKTISLYDAVQDQLLELIVSVEVAKLVEEDNAYAAEVLKAALGRNSSEETDKENQAPLGQITAETTYTNNYGTVVNGEDNEVSLYRWSSPCVLLLLDCYRKIEHSFTTGKVSHKKLWNQVAVQLNAQGHNVTGPQCASKLRSLKKTYKATKDHNNKSGNDRRKWQFFEVMDDIFSSKAWSQPVAIASSTGISIQNRNANVEDTNSVCSTGVSSSTKPNIASLLGKRLRQKEEHEKNREKRHREKMEMDRKLLEVLQNLVSK